MGTCIRIDIYSWNWNWCSSSLFAITHIYAIQKYYKERYAKKRYDSQQRWFKTRGVENLLEQEKDLFMSRIQEYKREQTITNLIGDE